MIFARTAAVVSAALAMALLTSSVAYPGDDLVTDGDGLTPVSASALTYGTVCRNATGSKTVAFALKHSGNGSIFANGATVSISMVSAPAGVTAGSFGSITLPSNWTTLSNGTLSNATTGVVTIATGAVTSYAGRVTFRATGTDADPDRDGRPQTLTRDDTVDLTATVAACDSTPPVLTLPGPMTAEATGASGAVVTYTATATDAVDGARPVSCSRTSGSTFALGATTVTCSAADASGNTSTGTFTVTVVDTTGPVLTLPASRTIEATGPAGAVETFAATATDAVDGARTVTCTPVSGSTFALGATTVACSATDTRSNSSTGSFVVTVRDTTAPTLSLPAGVTAEATSGSGAVVTYSASATDTVDTTVPVSCDRASGSRFPIGATLVRCHGIDDSNNRSDGSFTVNVGDTTRPALSLPGTITTEATGPTGAVVGYTADAHDAVDGDLTPGCTPVSGSTFGITTTAVSCTVSDTAGNTASGSFNVVVRDTTSPALTIPANLVAEATSAAGATVSYAASATDIVDPDVVVSCTAPSGTFPLGATTVTCTATDDFRNSVSRSFTVTVEDTTRPQLELPGDLTVEATSASGAAVVYTATATDAVSGTVQVTCVPAPGSVFALGTTPVSCSATDGARNRATGGFNVLVRDTTDPTLNVPGGVVEEATAASGALVTYTATASDTVDASVDIACAPASGARFPLGRTTVSCTATDDAGNDVTRSFDVVVQDTLAPVIGVPAAQTVEATSAAGATYAYTATASDAVSVVTPSCEPLSGATFPLGETTVRCTATDGAGNTGRASFTVTVVDTTPPALTLPANQTLEATGPSGATATYAASATDLVDGAVAATCTPASGSTYEIGTHTVTCSTRDVAGNSDSGTFTVQVQDTTPPALDLPADIVEEATGSTGNLVTYSATATDIVSGTVQVTCAPTSGSRFPITTTPVECSAVDGADNVANGGFSVTVRDKTAPAVTVPPSDTIEATGPSGAAYTYTATARDVVDGEMTPTCQPRSGSTFALGVTPVLCEATDNAGNTGSGGFSLTVVDTIAPVVTVPADRTAEATGPGGTAVTFTATATDAVAGSPAVTCMPRSGATFPLGVNTVTCTSSDGSNNTGSASFTITVVDTVAPVVAVPADRTVEATGPSGAVVSFTASATDAVSGSPATTCNPAGGSTFALGTTPVTCTAADGAGNVGTASFNVTVRDTIAPTLTVPANIVVTATGVSGAVVTYQASATDAVTTSVAAVCSPASGSTFAIGTTTVGCSATDGAGNTTTRSFTVSVRYAWSGFLQPVNDTAHQTGVAQSKFRLGSTVPLKFQLRTLDGGSVQQSGSPVFAKDYRGPTCNSATANEVPPEATSTSGTTYRWDSTALQYIYNFSTKGLAAGEWRTWAQTGDGQSYYVDLCLTK
ncbi:MAG TPA: HYR domain-containing protein [Mycobacteriales bacterium]|nr:HYR domain-containing protein [Mycobacteriales bacterium]